MDKKIEELRQELSKIEEMEDCDEKHHEIMESLKDDLNMFLWTRLPGDMTLDEAERVAVHFFNTINNAWHGVRIDED